MDIVITLIRGLFKYPWLLRVPAALLLFLLSSCSRDEAPQNQPLPAVTVYTVEARPVGEYREFIGSTEAARAVSLRAQVEGNVTAVNFQDGARVSQDQLLFEIDPRSYEAAVRSAEAQIDRATSEVERTTAEYERGIRLAPDGFISEQDLNQLKAAQNAAAADLRTAQSGLEQAQLNLSYTRIVAPFDGQVGESSVDVGDLVGPSSDTLVELINIDPIYVNFQLEESTYISLLQQQRTTQDAVNVDFSIRLPNGEIYSRPGTLRYTDTQVNRNLGSINVSLEFPNPDGIVVPGLFVTLIAEGRDQDNQPVIPQAAVQSGMDGYSVLVVDDENTVQRRLVELGRTIGPMWAVTAGLEPSERIIIDGLQKVRAGIQVNPVSGNIDPITGALIHQDSAAGEAD